MTRLASFMSVNVYPSEPVDKEVKKYREEHTINWKKLMQHGLVHYRARSDFVVVKGIEIGNVGVCDYFG